MYILDQAFKGETLLCMHATDTLHRNLHNNLHNKIPRKNRGLLDCRPAACIETCITTRRQVSLCRYFHEKHIEQNWTKASGKVIVRQADVCTSVRPGIPWPHRRVRGVRT